VSKYEPKFFAIPSFRSIDEVLDPLARRCVEENISFEYISNEEDILKDSCRALTAKILESGNRSAFSDHS